MRARYTGRTLARELALLLLAAVYCVPLYLLIALALETTAQTYKDPLALPLHPQWGNFSEAWGTRGQGGLAHPLESSLIITVASVIGLIALAPLAAFAIARHRSRLSSFVYLLFVIGFILPFQLGIIPLFVAMRHLGLVGNYLGIILLNIGLLMPLAVFLYTGFVRSLPRDYEEAAWVDGAGLLLTYRRVVFPLLLPITATVAVLTGVLIWNEFFVTLVFLAGSRIETLPVALYTYAGDYVTRWNLIFAGVAIAIAPILLFYLFVQRHLLRGFSGGVKG